MEWRAKVSRNTAIYALIAGAFLIRALMPVGYMPGNLLEGEFVQLCPSGMPQFPSDDAHHDHHAENETGDFAASSTECQFGISLSQLVLIESAPVSAGSINRTKFVKQHNSLSGSFPIGVAFRSRAPPLVVL